MVVFSVCTPLFYFLLSGPALGHVIVIVIMTVIVIVTGVVVTIETTITVTGMTETRIVTETG